MASERGKKCIESISRFYICQQKLIHKPKFLPKSKLALINFPNVYRNIPYDSNLCRENHGTCGKVNAYAYGQGIVILEEAKKRTLLAKCQRVFKDSHHSCLFTDLEGQILGANTAALETYGYTQKKLCGMKIYDLSPMESKDLVNKQLQEAYSSGITYETNHVRNNGECFPVEVNSFRIETLLVSIIQDITQRKHLEREFVNSEAIKVIGKVASGLAHEVRNGITSVHGFIQLVASGILSQDRFAKNSEVMLLELNHVDRIISELLLLASNRSA
ncbi:PAS domain S-box protein [Desulfosporosinus sp.]|uniref:PAS domain S-box protein n=1 Tax=Desulfosporosinus sp. TaxID=157907 RepID=UPI0025C43C63|nr:PAS domain S-box protein [Desulfosporosinus sp.]MBC2728264.1 PAS domain S-box protein [Desulfosporosinus sp.]